MKPLVTFLLLGLITLPSIAQNAPDEKQRKAFYELIGQYSQARENRDTVLLKKILAEDIDQLVSTGEWRNGIRPAVKGMLNSSAATPGTRTLTIEKMRMLSKTSALVDCRYVIENADGSLRKMWSTFVVVSDHDAWKISAIRNMLPTSL